MEKPIQISTIDIGNDGSAFVEIQVGRKGSIEQVNPFKHFSKESLIN